jgi:hypothetical protein
VWQTISYYSALAVQSLFSVFGVRLYEETHYDVIERIGDQVEIRHYAPRVAAEVDRCQAPGQRFHTAGTARALVATLSRTSFGTHVTFEQHIADDVQVSLDRTDLA